MSAREIPNLDQLVDYGHAVAGHAGVLSDADGELFIKPCTQKELDFYQSAAAKFEEFTEIMPLFMGCLSLADPAEGESKDATTWKPNKDKRIKTDQAIVLENCTNGYKKPNILDAKLDYGCRIAGMRVYKGSENATELDDDQYKVYDRDYGRASVTNETFVDAVRQFVFNKAAGIDNALAKAICQGFVQELQRVEKILETHESRMYSASILFIYEGDVEALEASINRNNTLAENLEKAHVRPSRIDSGICLDDEDDEDDEIVFPKVYTVKLIDFAHAKWVPGEGPDENSLVGVRSLRRIFEELAA
ncbi:unnamed protein product [Parascedosporium putredinis]|uniref:Kinase n=1 Tax=Parascedosporium putredinis TaxID=1442378 RepID=A0A9P1GUE1_9PEZI|nr:unnamed protein product [Parascedosporium putredinis]CAI7987832.1 unnamed protein product [Parascedosporium putredinis]